MLRLASCLVLLVVLACTALAVDIETVPVGNPGNAGELSGNGGSYGPERICGAVDYAYNIGKYEVTAGQYRDFLNAVDPGHTNPYSVYNSSMDTSSYGCQITWNAGASTYDFSGRPSGTEADWANRPVNGVSWYDAARFTNWLTTGDTEDGVYKFSGGRLQSIMDHQAAAAAYGSAYFIPTEDEWYKAAYYDPTDYDPDGPGGVDPGAGYWDYPTWSDDPNLPSNDLVEPTDPGNNATFYLYGGGWTIGSPYYRTEVGAHENSESPYGTFDQGGNVYEWNEAILPGPHRGLRGGSFDNAGNGALLHALSRNSSNYPGDVNGLIGFRVASIPEPGSITLLATAALGLLACGWRKRRS